jgi:hypothetical protein
LIEDFEGVGRWRCEREPGREGKDGAEITAGHQFKKRICCRPVYLSWPGKWHSWVEQLLSPTQRTFETNVRLGNSTTTDIFSIPPGTRKIAITNNPEIRRFQTKNAQDQRSPGAQQPNRI